jgi:SPP1 gp7 family putative phage head morphogenesis protein
MLDEIAAAAEDLLTALAGPDRTRYGFTHRSAEDETPDGLLQQHEQQSFAVGVSRAGKLMQQETDLTVGRQSPAVEALLDHAFDRLSQNGRLRLESILDDVQSILVSGAANGLSPLAVARQLRGQFDAYQGWEFQRLARTEAAFAAERGTREQLRGFGVEKVEILTGAGACPICEEYDGKVFAIDAEEDLPPYHPNCMCACSPVISEAGDSEEES